jgi:hypothetical protein
MRLASQIPKSALRLIVALACFSAVTAHALDPARADFKKEHPSRAARSAAERVLESEDSGHRPFAIVDKIAARVYVFDAHGSLLGAAPALLGIAIGDHSVPGVGTMELADIRIQDRTTPAGRFEAAIGQNFDGKEILWVDYDAAISMHPVIDTKPEERRPHRLATPTARDNRISFGCINVPLAFFENVVSRAFKATSGVVYILPEIQTPESQALVRFRGPTGRNSAGQ